MRDAKGRFCKAEKREEKVFSVGVKGFGPGMVCREKQYKENSVFEEKGGEICGPGVIHYCEYPLDVFGYYPPVDDDGNLNEFAEVEALDEVRHDCDKSATAKIRIGNKISYSDLTQKAVDYILEHADNNTKNSAGDQSVASNSGSRSVASNSGNYSVASNSGDRSVASNSGNYSVASNSGFQSVASNSGFQSVASNSGFQSVASNSGDRSVASNSGNYSVASNSGNYSVASNSGSRSVASNSGDRSVASNSGSRSVASNSGSRSVASNSGSRSVAIAEGKESFAFATGLKGEAKGALGCWIGVSEWKEIKGKYHIVDFKSAKVDGKKIKADTFYTLKNGKFVEVK